MQLIDFTDKYLSVGDNSLVRKLLISLLLMTALYVPGFAAGPTFVCDGRPYPTFGSNPTTLQEMDKQTLAVTNIATVSPSGTINATGYNILDNYIYGLQGKNFYQLAADGTYIILGQPTGVGATAGVAWNIGVTYAGTMDASGNWYGHDNNYVYHVNIGSNPSAGSLTYERFARSGSFTGKLADLAFNPLDGNLYGMSGGALRRITMAGVGSTVTTSGSLSGGAGGAWSTSSGVLYFYNNSSGLLYSVDMLPTIPVANFVGNVASNGTFDATACTPPVLAKSVNTSTVSAGEMFTYTFKLSNPFTNPLTVDFTDTLPAGLSFVTGSLSPASPGGGTIATFTTNTLNIDNLTIPAGLPPANELVFTAQATADGNILTTTTIPNTAQITYGVNSVTSDNPDTGPIDDPTSVTIHPNDWGDAPLSMTSVDVSLTSTYGDAKHKIDSNVYLGALIDSETATQGSGLLADGDDSDGEDDDDGVTFPLAGATSVLRVNEVNAVTIQASVNGFLNAWIDWNQDGDWDDASETIAINTPLVAGTNTLNLTPNIAYPQGATYLRFRFTSESVTNPAATGLMNDGEVEDYRVNIVLPPPVDVCSSVILNTGFEAAPHPSSYFIQPEDLIEGWATIADSPTSGASYAQRNSIEIWKSGFNNVPAFEGTYFAELNAWVPGMLYQDVELTPGSSYTWSFAHRGRSGPDVVNAFMGAPGSEVLQGTYTTDPSGWKVYKGIYVVPAGQDITRFGLQAQGSSSVGNFIDALKIPGGCDFGDAPDSYGTLLSNDAAYHVSNKLLFLGDNPGDSETDGQPSVTADLDDTIGEADEDGISSLNLLTDLDRTYSIDTTLTNQTGNNARLIAWIDFDGSGTFDADEVAIRDIPTGTVNSTVSLNWSSIPLDIQTGNHYLRLRLTTDPISNLEPTGLKSDGEVEDYPITIISAGARVSGRVFIDTNSNATIDPAESGIGGTVLVLLQASSGICRSVITNASGEYEFLGVSAGDFQIYQAHGETTPIPQNCSVALVTNPAGYQSTSPDFLSVTVAGTDINDQNFGEVIGFRFEPDNQGQVLPGNTASYTHVLTTETDGTVTFTSGSNGYVTSGWSHTLYQDSNCDGFLNGTEANMIINGLSIAISAGQQVCLINQVYAPSNVTALDQYDVVIAAEFSYAGGTLAQEFSEVYDVTIAQQSDSGTSRLELTKTVENLTSGTVETATLNQANPGDTLKYRIYFQNTGTAKITDLSVNDTVPDYTIMVAGSNLCEQTPVGMGCTSTATLDVLDWLYTGDLLGGSSGFVSYEVTVDN